MDDNDDLNLDPEQIATDPPADTPPPDPAAAAKPTFELAIDDRTKYTDPEQAKKGFSELRGDRDRHKTRAEQLEDENRRLKTALGGDPPAKSSVDPAVMEKQKKWLEFARPELGVLTKEDLKDPAVRKELEAIVEEREQQQLYARGRAHVLGLLKTHGIELPEAKQQALLQYIGGILDHPSSADLSQRLSAGDMGVLTELVEDHYAAHIESRKQAQEAEEARQQTERDRRGRYAKVEDAKDKMKRNVPAGPPRGGGAAVANTPNDTPKTRDERRKRMNEVLDRLAS